jgi:hypothetical protein
MLIVHPSLAWLALKVWRVHKLRAASALDASALDLEHFVHENTLAADQFVLEGAYGPYRKLVRFQAQKDAVLCPMQARTKGIVVSGTVVGQRGESVQVMLDEIAEIYFDPQSEDIWVQTPQCVYLLDKPLVHYTPYFNALRLGLAKYSSAKA